MEKFIRELRNDDIDEISMLATLRDELIDKDVLSHLSGYDVTGELVSCPKHVVFYTAMYIKYLKGDAIA